MIVEKYRVLRMAALLGILILPGCSQGILEGIGIKTAATIAEDDIEVAEAVQSKELFDRILDQDTTVLSYPVGRYNEVSLRLSEEAGYKMAVSTEPGEASRDQGMHALHRVRISPGLSVDGFASLIENASKH